MGSLRRKRLFQLIRPGRIRLIRQVADQIQTPAGETPLNNRCLQPSASLQEVRTAMATSQGRQNRIVKALSTQAHPIDPLLSEGVEIQPPKTGGIHLQADLRSALQPKAPTQGLQHLTDLERGEQRWSPTADIHRRQGRACRRQADLLEQLLEVQRDRPTAGASGGVGLITQRHHGEVAVKATPMAEGNVDVGASRRGCGHHPEPFKTRWCMLPASRLSSENRSPWLKRSSSFCS